MRSLGEILNPQSIFTKAAIASYTNSVILDDRDVDKETTRATMETLGYRTTTMKWAEVFPAVPAGTIDGAICCTAEWVYTIFTVSDVGNTYVPYNAFVESTQIYMGQRSWAKLDEKQQAVIQSAVNKASNAIIDQE